MRERQESRSQRPEKWRDFISFGGRGGGGGGGGRLIHRCIETQLQSKIRGCVLGTGGTGGQLTEETAVAKVLNIFLVTGGSEVVEVERKVLTLPATVAPLPPLERACTN